jgi:tetratricopeptide (TPR) repeat protein
VTSRREGRGESFLLLRENRGLERAEQLFAEAVPLRNGEPVLEAPRVADALLLLGVARESLGRLKEAVWAFEWCVRAFSATVGDGDPQTIRARSNLGRAYAALGRADDAQPLLGEAIALFEAHQNDSELAVALNALGLVR